MNVCIRNVCDSDAPAVVSIFNYFVLNSFAAYCEKEMGPEVFDRFRKASRVFLLLEVDEQPVGFGMVQEYNAFENFKQTGMLTYFILPGFTGQGLGTQLLNRLLNAGRELGITNLVAHISSKNEQSLRFHQKHGFRECGRLKEMGIKFNEPFDIVWVQKTLTGNPDMK
ncbi:MAG TPA: GNAT family N-acetyltransferase [Candidatus Deferrimicrobium sp.]|nr:GNAT family N-acetyltransferase [Candidatus Kapabacteria bacterium]HLP62547.1 GNAT family N-acetyltransferase [Candidatus Deferrimicrobium sp.]